MWLKPWKSRASARASSEFMQKQIFPFVHPLWPFPHLGSTDTRISPRKQSFSDGGVCSPSLLLGAIRTLSVSTHFPLTLSNNMELEAEIFK